MSTVTVETGPEGAAGDDLLGRLEALAARLEAQSALIAQQGERIAAQDAVIARFTATPAAPGSQPAADTTSSKLGRRGLLAGGAALLGAALGKLGSAEPARAAHPSSDTNFIHAGAGNLPFGRTAIFGGSTTTSMLLVSNSAIGYAVPSAPDAIQGYTSASVNDSAGVRGISAGTGAGVRGEAVSGAGVWGQATSYFGVRGESTSHVGVGGISNSDWGVWGRSQTNQGVRGESVSGVGVFGISNSPANAPKEGVRGESIHGPGVWGKSTNHAGVYSQGGGGNIALFGITQTGTALAAQATTPAGQAGLFLGNVNIIGNLTVTGSFPKSAGVPHPDGSTRRMYCMEGPESAFEDWGRGQLQGGKADIKLDPEFAALVTADDYNVFLQPEGPTALYVSQRTATGFEVREVEEGTLGTPAVPGRERSVRPTTTGGTVTFSYRVLAKRKDLVGKTRRMERIDLPRGVRRGGDRGIMADTALLPPPADGPAPEEPNLDEKPRGRER